MRRILAVCSASAILALWALAMPAPVAAAKQSSSASTAIPGYTADVATEELSAHRRRYRHTHRYYGHRRYYGYPYYAYEPGPYYYGPRYYGPPFPFWPFW